MSRRHIPQWSWGRYFLRAINKEKEDRAPRMEELLDHIAEVRKVAVDRNVNWYSLKDCPHKVQIDRLTAVAAEAGLPAQLKESTQRTIVGVLGSGTVISGVAAK